METKKVRLGSISLLFTVILLCVVVLSVLTITTARADYVMAQRMAESVQKQNALENEGQRWLAQADRAIREKGWAGCAASLEGAQMDGDVITAQIEEDGAILHIRLEKDGGSYKITEWKTEAVWEEDLTWNLF